MPIIQDQEYFRKVQKMVYNDRVKKNVEIMINSSECRKYLTKNARTAPLEDLLIAAVNCIYDLTGDSQFRRQVIEDIERRRNDSLN